MRVRAILADSIATTTTMAAKVPIVAATAVAEMVAEAAATDALPERPDSRQKQPIALGGRSLWPTRLN